MHIGNPLKKTGRVSISSVTNRLWLVFIFLTVTFTTADAQWRIPTPRDTFMVPANQKTFVSSKITLTSGVEMWIAASNTFTENDGSNTFGMDAAYGYLVNGGPLAPQLKNPFTYGGKTHLSTFTVTTIPGVNERPFQPLENSYQSSHNYTSRVLAQGQRFQFRILADKDADYPRNNGGLNLKLARWTAGIAIKSVNLDFGNVFIGTSKSILDSLASYGLDPLQIDSIKIIDAARTGDFSFISERDNRFTLPTEQTNQLKVTFSPSSRGIIIAQLYIYSHNADPASTIHVIYLTGFGIAPDFGVGPHQIDFGKVRIGSPVLGFTNISNAKGNAELVVNTNSFYRQYQPPATPLVFSLAPPSYLPYTMSAGSIGQLRTKFSPTARVKYKGVFQVRGDNNVPPDSVILTGEGAAPIPELSPVPKNGTLDFGIVYSGNTSQQLVTLTNKGNWTLSVIYAHLYSAAFSFSPSDTDFIVEPDSSRVFTITFHPNVGSFDSLHLKGIFELVYDDYTKDTIILNGMEILPKIVSSNKVYDFGKVRTGLSKTSTVTMLRSISNNTTIRLQEEGVFPGPIFTEVGRIGQIEALQSVPFVAKFYPLQAGPDSAWAFWTASNKRDSVLLKGIGAVAKAIFTPPLLNFGIVPSNKAYTLVTTLLDSGDFPLRVDSMRISGPNAKDFTIISPSQTPFVPFTIVEGTSVNINIRFITNDLTGGVHQATLCVYYDDGSKDCIPLEAIEEAQYLQYGQSSINFGMCRINTHTKLPAVFRNGSNVTLTVGAVSVSSPAKVFYVNGPLNPVKPQSKESVEVDFNPIVRGSYSGYLHAFGGDIKTDSIELRGIGAEPLPKFSDTVVDFGIVKLNILKLKEFSLLDTGDWPVKVINIELIEDSYNEFSYREKISQKAITTDSIPGQKYSTYEVTFKPAQIIVYHSAKMVFTFDDGTQGIVILKGYDESPKLVLDEDSVNFGKVRIGFPANQTVNIVSTSPDTLIAQNLNLVTVAPASTFSSNPSSGPIMVMPRTFYATLSPVQLTFDPQAIGNFTAMLVSSGADISDDTIFITGTGAAPKPMLSSLMLDFGTLFPGYSASRSFTLTDNGNWPLSVMKVDIIGANKADFTLRNIPQQFNIVEDSTANFIVDFLSTTPYQAVPRTAQIVFTMDDNSTFTVDMIEQDIAPITVDLKLDNTYARMGDDVYPCLRLKTELPDSLHVLDLKGTITYDPLIVDLDRNATVIGDLLSLLGNWNLIKSNTDLPGIFTYELQGSAAPLTKTGSLLRLKFKPHANVAAGSISPLQDKLFNFPLRTEFVTAITDGVIVIDSTCGNTHLLSSNVTANMVDQNTPNPFGANIGHNETQIPFDIGFDDVAVTIRILDMTGREVARPVDNVIFKRGRYAATVTAQMVGSSGSYFYEFRAADMKPVFKKMIINR